MTATLCSTGDGAPVHATGLCLTCYRRQAARRRRGTPVDAPVQRRRADSERVTIRLDALLAARVRARGTPTDVIEAALLAYLAE